MLRGKGPASEVGGVKSGKRGFTLIELMLVVAIIGLLAAIAIPKFANLVIKAREASVKGALGALRSALSIYYADAEGNYPYMTGFGLAVLTPRYISEIPSVALPHMTGHPRGNGFYNNIGVANGSAWSAWAFPFFVINPSGLVDRIVLDCPHTDTRGITISLW